MLKNVRCCKPLSDGCCIQTSDVTPISVFPRVFLAGTFGRLPGAKCQLQHTVLRMSMIYMYLQIWTQPNNTQSEVLFQYGYYHSTYLYVHSIQVKKQEPANRRLHYSPCPCPTKAGVIAAGARGTNRPAVMRCMGKRCKKSPGNAETPLLEKERLNFCWPVLPISVIVFAAAFFFLSCTFNTQRSQSTYLLPPTKQQTYLPTTSPPSAQRSDTHLFEYQATNLRTTSLTYGTTKKAPLPERPDPTTPGSCTERTTREQTGQLP